MVGDIISGVSSSATKSSTPFLLSGPSSLTLKNICYQWKLSTENLHCTHLSNESSLTKISRVISHLKVVFHMWVVSIPYVKWKFHMWMSHFICETHVSYTRFAHVKFWTSSFHMWFRCFIFEKVPNSCMKWKFHVWKCSNSICFSYLKWNVKFS